MHLVIKLLHCLIFKQLYYYRIFSFIYYHIDNVYIFINYVVILKLRHISSKIINLIIDNINFDLHVKPYLECVNILPGICQMCGLYSI